MAQEETNIVNKLRAEASARGDRLFRNNRGKFKTLDGLRVIEAGLSASGSSDLIGWTRIEITPDMVGTVHAVFTAVEVKTKKGKASEDQKKFIQMVLDAGGIAKIHQ